MSAIMKEDRRPAFVLDSVEGIDFRHCNAARAEGVPTFVLMKAKNISVRDCAGVKDFDISTPARMEK